LYNENGQLLAQDKIIAGTTYTQEMIWLDDMPIGVSQGGSMYGILTDHLNTPRRIFNTATQLTAWSWNAVDDAFGESAAVASGLEFDLRFAGQFFDAESGLHYNYLRDGYESQTGRYTQSDPIGLAGGISTYGYVGGNPMNAVDPMGLKQVILVNEKRDPILFAVSQKYWDDSDACLVYAHGGPDVVEDGRGEKIKRITSGKALEKFLLAEGCKPKQPVILYSCRTGKGDNSIAEQLSKTKSFPDVAAPNRQIWFNRPWFWSSGPNKIFGKLPDGKTINPNDPGSMRKF
jgi:RHS repeat-associated protein